MKALEDSLAEAPASTPHCKRCHEPLSVERLEQGARVFCSKQCKRNFHRANTPSKKRIQRRHSQRQAYGRFHSATVDGKRLEVEETAAAQRQAKKLIEAGLCAYVNAKGLIRDVGAPVNPKLAGRIYRKRKKREQGRS